MQHQVILVGFVSLSVMVAAGCGSSVEHEHSSYSSPDTKAEHTGTRIHVTSGDMKPRIVLLWDKLMLRKRSLIETVNDQLKNICQIAHTRHRSVNGFLVNLLAYTHQPKKPGIRWGDNEKHQLAIIA